MKTQMAPSRPAAFCSQSACHTALALVFLCVSGGGALADPAGGSAAGGGFFGCTVNRAADAFACPTGPAYQQVYSRFTGLKDTSGDANSSAPIAQNLRLVENLYQAPAFGEVTGARPAAYYQTLAALNSQMQAGPALPGNDDESWYDHERLVAVYNLWNLADPTRSGDNDLVGAGVSTRFNIGSLLAPGGNAAPQGYYKLLSHAAGYSGLIEGPAKTHYAGVNVYGDSYIPQLGIASSALQGDPRPFQTSAIMSRTDGTGQQGWQLLPPSAQPPAYAISIQQDNPPSTAGMPDTGVGLQPQAWSVYREGQPSFPSGHSTLGEAYGLSSAIVVPRHYKELVMAAAAFGRSRNIMGVHYPLDVIGGRMAGLFGASYMIDYVPLYDDDLVPGDVFVAGENIAYIKDRVIPAMSRALGEPNQSVYADDCRENLAACLAAGAIPTAETFRDLRRQYVNLATYSDVENGNGGYGFTPDPLYAGRLMGASAAEQQTLDVTAPLLATRFPYLSYDDWREILRTTALASGGPLDNGSGWDRINLYAAADGFGSLLHDVTVTMDASKAGFHAFDVWANDIVGTGGLTKQGTGTLVLAGDSTYSGGTAVEAGILGVSGSIAGPVTVAAGAELVNAGIISGDVSSAGVFVHNGVVSGAVTSSGVLSGTGSIGDLAVVKNGTLATGNSIATMTVRGNYLLGQDATRAVEVRSDGMIDLLDVGGVATLLGGTVSAMSEDGFTPVLGARYVFLHADGGIVGTHDRLEGGLFPDSLYPFLTTGLSYTENDASLAVERSGLSFAAAGRTANARSVGAALDAFVAGSALDLPLTHLTIDAYDLAAGQLSGQIYASAQTALQNSADIVRGTLQTRLAQAFAQNGDASRATAGGVDAARLPGTEASVWMSAYGNWSDVDSTPDTAELSSTLAGSLAGFDVPLGNWARFGLAGGYGRDNFSTPALSAAGHASTTTIAAYGSAEYGPVQAYLGGSFAWHDVDISRTIGFSGYTASPSANYSATTGQIFGEAAYDFSLADLDMQAFGGLAYMSTSTDGFSESGGLAALTGSGDRQSNTLSTLGIRFGRDFTVGQGALRTNAILGWQHAFGDTSPTAALTFSDSGAGFTVAGAPIARDAAVLGLDVGATVMDHVSVAVGYRGLIGTGSAQHAAFGKLKIAF